jgi:CBS domain-containing protein
MLRENKRQKRVQGELSGKLDRGSLGFKSKLSEHEGDIMMVAKRDVIMIPPTMTIMGAVKMMMHYNFRRLPVSDPGTNRLVGIVTITDVLNFFGGGDKAQIIENKHKGNLLSAVNEEISSVMEEELVTLRDYDTIESALKKMIDEGLSGFPILNVDDKVVGIVSERDFISLIADVITGKKVSDYMNRNVVTISPDATVEAAAKIMIANDFRRLPIVHEGVMLGIVTATDIVNYLGSGEAFEKIVTGNMHEALGVPIKTLIDEAPVTIHPDTDLGIAAELMIARDIGVLPVISDESLIGIITEWDFLTAIIG